MNQPSDSKSPVKSNPSAPAVKSSSSLPTQGSGQFVEMQDLLPIISSFREHMEQEQAKHQAQVRKTGVWFVIAGIAIAAVPVLSTRQLVKQMRHERAAESLARSESNQALADSLNKLASATQALRDELGTTKGGAVAEVPEVKASAVVEAQPEPEAVTAPVEAIVPVEISPPVPEEVKAEEPDSEKAKKKSKDTVKEEKPEAAPVVIEKIAPPPPPPPVSEAERPDVIPTERPTLSEVERPAVSPVERPSEETALVVTAVPPAMIPEPKEMPRSDLESLLQQVQSAIAEKQRQINSGSPAP